MSFSKCGCKVCTSLSWKWTFSAPQIFFYVYFEAPKEAVILLGESIKYKNSKLIAFISLSFSWISRGLKKLHVQIFVVNKELFQDLWIFYWDMAVLQPAWFSSTFLPLRAVHAYAGWAQYQNAQMIMPFILSQAIRTSAKPVNFVCKRAQEKWPWCLLMVWWEQKNNSDLKTEAGKNCSGRNLLGIKNFFQVMQCKGARERQWSTPQELHKAAKLHISWREQKNSMISFWGMSQIALAEICWD